METQNKELDQTIINLSEINTTTSINVHRRRCSTIESMSSVNTSQKFNTKTLSVIFLKVLHSLVRLNSFTINKTVTLTIRPERD